MEVGLLQNNTRRRKSCVFYCVKKGLDEFLNVCIICDYKVEEKFWKFNKISTYARDCVCELIFNYVTLHFILFSMVVVENNAKAKGN